MSQPAQVQVLKSKSPPYMKHLLAKGLLHVVLVEEQHKPDISVVPAGHVPVRLGRVQLEPGRAHAKFSAFASRHILPPVMVALAEPIPRFNETCAFVPQLVPNRQVENATPVADAHTTVVPVLPVRFYVFRSFEPMCEKKGVKWSKVPPSNEAKF